jgi:2-oxoglutarate dehydrogenase E2 component (dihydrolipoamide succinyltransferase)
VSDLVVPALGESVTEATVAAWLHTAGERVGVDEPLVELETDKATVEVCAPHACVVAEILVGEGETVEMGAVLAKLTPAVEGAVAPPAVPSEPVRAQEAREPTRLSGLDPSRAPRSGPGDTITADDLRAFLNERADAPGREGPAARKLLAERGLSAADVTPSGPGGRVTKGDVLSHVPAPATGEPAPTTASASPREERVRMPRIRQTIARRLKEAQNTAAILTTFNEVDMGAVMELRNASASGRSSRRSTGCGSASRRSSRRRWWRLSGRCPPSMPRSTATRSSTSTT